MTVELTVTSITVQPEISAANVVITPTFTSGGGLTAPILSISKNGVNVEPDELKNVDIEVPTNTSDLTNDSNFVSDANYVHTDNNYDNEAVAEVAKIADKANSADVYTKSETYSQTEINNKLSAVYKYKGSVLTYDLLPIDAENADVWNVVNGITPELNGMNYAWNSTLSAWDAIGGIIGIATLTENGLMSKEDFKKLSDLYTKADLDLILADKSDVGHNHSGEGINPDYIVLDEEYTDLTMVALPVGALFYNVDQLSWLLKTSANTYLNLGEENTYIAKNGDNVTHLEGQVTYVTSGGGNLDVMTLASSANGKIDALATQDVLHTGNGRGMYCFGGKVRTFPYSNVIKSTDNENTWIEGAELYLCSEAGRYSTTKEAAPAKCSVVGKITQRNGANISVSFRPFKAIAFEDLSNVDGTATTLADTDEHLFKDVVTGLIKKITHSNLVTKLATWFYTKVLADRTFVSQNGGTIYHITRWFTPTSALTIAANGLSATITSGQFTSAMTGAKLRLTGGVNEPIITYVNSNTINLSFAVDSSFFGQSVAVADWGVYNIALSITENYIFIFPKDSKTSKRIYYTNEAGSFIIEGSATFYNGAGFDSANSILINSSGMQLSASDVISWAGVNVPNVQNQTKDIGIRRISDGLMEIYNGVTNGVLRDLKLRSLFADKIAPNTTTGLKIGTVYNTSLTTATNNTAVISIAVQDTTGFPATGTILIGGVTSVAYTSKTTTSFVFASTVIPTYAIGTEVLVTSAGDYTTIEADGTIKLNGAATVWGDIDFPIIIRNTGVGIPTMATFNGNLMMPQWAVNDFNQCESQEFVHEWKEGSTCYFHLHLDTNGTDTTDRYVKFEIEYAYSANGVWQFPAVVTTADILIPANTADRTQIIAPLFNFTPTNSKIGDHCIARLKRVASTGLAPTNNPFIPMLQMHVEKDTFGSRNMTTKL